MLDIDRRVSHAVVNLKDGSSYIGEIEKDGDSVRITIRWGKGFTEVVFSAKEISDILYLVDLHLNMEVLHWMDDFPGGLEKVIEYHKRLEN